MKGYKVTTVQYPGTVSEIVENVDLNEVMKKMTVFIKAHPGAYMYRPYCDSSLTALHYSDRESGMIYGIVVEEAES